MTSSDAPPDSRSRDDWTLRPYRAGDEGEIMRLFTHVFGRETSEAQWRWKFKTRRWTTENVWIGVHHDRPICHFAAMPARMRVGGCDKDAAVVVDVMTAPDFRRRGLLTTVARSVMQAWAGAGVSFLYGLPNEQWGSRAAAIGLRPMVALRRFVLPLRPQQTLARKLDAPGLARRGWIDAAWSRILDHRLGPNRDVSTRAVEAAGPEFDALWGDCAPAFPITMVRDREWVKWRYFDAPGLGYRVLLAERDGRPAGFAAYRLARTDARVDGLITEIFARPDDAQAWSALLIHAVRAARDAGAENVFALEVPGSPGHHALRRAAFVPARWEFTVQAAPVAGDVAMDALKRAGHWHLSGSDFDVV
jgi:GNAT superfamily N-acetyltransferase